MNRRPENIEEVAEEFFNELTPEDIENIHMHIGCYDYYDNNWHITDKYHYLFEKYARELRSFLGDLVENIENTWAREIYHLTLIKLFPEFKRYERIIDYITGGVFSDLNAHYYIQYNRNFLEDIVPDDYCNFKYTEDMANETAEMRAKRESEEYKKYATAIAERIWEFDKFKATALEFGYSDEEIDDIHNKCIHILKRHSAFVPLQILFANHKDDEKSLAELKKYKNHIDLSASSNCYLPEYLPEYFTYDDNKEVKFIN